ncbi:M81 family metallopeptidase [Limnohabitans sp. Rim8]|uniref:M81 family metallopeptidase n=1 Tax=Limnohabitans sp. Rim8 TaxID=1100718 RepID=UPI002607CC1E|nr:M81 family metallopeptidase [Limnohabitans sp. Rim8]
MRLLIAMMMHETNTFSPVPTDLQRFALGLGQLPPQGALAVQAYRNTGTATGAFIDLAEAAGADFELVIAAHAAPSGPVHDEAYDVMASTIVEAVAKGGYDGIFLDLHGAMVTQSFEDGEGELLRRIRAVDPLTPMGIAYDMHANVYADMVELAQVVAGYHTYPHVDMFETGMRAGRALLRCISGEVRPSTSWARLPMIPHIMRQSSLDEPNRSIQARAQQMEKEGALSASVFTGFPHADIENAGLSVVVVTDNNPVLAEKLRDELLQMAWLSRSEWVYPVEPLAESVARAKTLTQGPVVLLDHYDNAASGGTMDTTAVLAEVLHQGLRNVAFFAIFDPQAVQQAIQAGVGNTVSLTVGGKLKMPLMPHRSEPVLLNGVVKSISSGKYIAKGPMSKGARQDMGASVVIDTGHVEVALISRHVEPFDVNALISLGIDPTQKQYVVLKSRVHWRAGMGELAKAVVECAGAGACTSDYSELDFKRLRRPIYPLDLDLQH